MRSHAEKIPVPASCTGISVYSDAPEGTRTPNLLIRSQMLYPIELRAQSWAVQDSNL
jgi:hypothetical protein